MNKVPIGGISAFATRFRIPALLLCTAAICGAASVELPRIHSSHFRSVDKDDFNLPHGAQLNRVRFLTDGVRTVEIPAGSLLHLPENGRIRIAEDLVGGLVDWVVFFSQNFDELRQVGVSRGNLRGNRVIHPAILEHLVRINKVGIAIAAGRPVALPIR